MGRTDRQDKMADEPKEVTECREKLTALCKDAVGEKSFADITATDVAKDIQEAAMKLVSDAFAKHKVFINVFVFNVNGYAETRSTLWTKDDKDLSVMYCGEGKVGVLLRALANPM